MNLEIQEYPDLLIYLEKAIDPQHEGRGPGSRGGEVAYYSESGKPIYVSALRKRARATNQSMNKLRDEANQSGKGEDHAVAAKESLASAVAHHFSNNGQAANHSLQNAKNHIQAYKNGGHSSNTTRWVDSNHDKITSLVSAKKG